MQAALIRNEVILNNIANADTPGFKRKDVVFDKILGDVLNEGKRTGKLDLSRAVPRAVIVDDGYKYRIDGNNVDMETEMVTFYENSMKYETMVNGVINNYKRINLALSIK